MGLPFRHPERISHTRYQQANWQDPTGTGQVAISVSTECLGRLLRNRQLHVEDLDCLDSTSKRRVHQLLLTLLRH